VHMRRRMLADGTTKLDVEEGWFDLKRSPGGIVDIEFVVQYLVLANASAFPQLTEWSDVVRVLQSLHEAGILSVSDTEKMTSAYLAYRAAVHVASLAGDKPLGRVDRFHEHLQAISAIRDRWLPGIV